MRFEGVTTVATGVTAGTVRTATLVNFRWRIPFRFTVLVVLPAYVNLFLGLTRDTRLWLNGYRSWTRDIILIENSMKFDRTVATSDIENDTCAAHSRWCMLSARSRTATGTSSLSWLLYTRQWSSLVALEGTGNTVDYRYSICINFVFVFVVVNWLIASLFGNARRACFSGTRWTNFRWLWSTKFKRSYRRRWRVFSETKIISISEEMEFLHSNEPSVIKVNGATERFSYYLR